MAQVIGAHNPQISQEVARTKLRGALLFGARLVWLAAITFALWLFVAGISARFSEYSRGFLGLDWDIAANGDIILKPSPGTPAAEAGLRTGDVLLALNGQAITPPLTPTRVQQMLSDPSFARVSFQVRHNDGTIARYSVARDNRGLDGAGIPVELFARYNVLLDLGLVLSFTALALLIFVRRSDDWFAFLMAASLVFFAVRIPPEVYTLTVLEPQWIIPVNLFLIASRSLLIVWLCLFPNGQFVPRFARGLVAVAVAYYTFCALFYDPSARTYYSTPQFLVDGAFIILGLVAQGYRYRRVSTVREQLQTRWVLYGVAVAFVVFNFFEVLPAFLPSLGGASRDYFRFVLIQQPLTYLAFMLVPLTMTISILRYHLWRINLLVNRTLVYLPLTAMLAGILAGTMSLGQKLFLALTGQESALATAMATLFIVALFEPLKKWLQELVDRYFKQSADPATRLKPFQEMLQMRIFEIDLPLMTRRALAEAVRAFDAESGQIVMHDGRGPVCEFTIGRWREPAQLSMPLRAEKQIGNFALGPRKSGEAYDTQDQVTLEQFATVVAQTCAASFKTKA